MENENEIENINEKEMKIKNDHPMHTKYIQCDCAHKKIN